MFIHGLPSWVHDYLIWHIKVMHDLLEECPCFEIVRSNLQFGPRRIGVVDDVSCSPKLFVGLINDAFHLGSANLRT